MKASSIRGLKVRTRMFGAELLPGPDGNCVQIRSGQFDDGRRWEVPEVEVVDEARNKVTLRFLPDENRVEPGFYDLVLDTAATPKGQTAIEVVHFSPMSERNGKATPAVAGAVKS